MKFRPLVTFILIALSFTAISAARAEEVFIGNPGKSLNFFHFDRERLVNYTLLREVQKEMGVQ